MRFMRVEEPMGKLVLQGRFSTVLYRTRLANIPRKEANWQCLGPTRRVIIYLGTQGTSVPQSVHHRH
jgi:hypothetical protein